MALVAPATRSPASASTACQVTNATLTWGFKASFRAYITSSIANGDWTTSGNAGYTTPNFIWSKGTGTFDATATSGQIAFTGGIRFTGHEGLLDSTFSNLRLKFTNANTALLILDYTGVSMAEALAGSSAPTTYPNVGFVALTLASGTRGGSGTTTTFTSVPTSITANGYAAFGSYVAGTAMDPMTISITRDAACAGGASTTNPGKGAPAIASGKGGTSTTTTGPGIVPAEGLQISTRTASPFPSGPATTGTAPIEHSGGDVPTKTLAILASAGSSGTGVGDGLLFALAGLVVGIVATLLIQFAHLHLLAKRKALDVE